MSSSERPRSREASDTADEEVLFEGRFNLEGVGGAADDSQGDDVDDLIDEEATLATLFSAGLPV